MLRLAWDAVNRTQIGNLPASPTLLLAVLLASPCTGWTVTNLSTCCSEARARIVIRSYCLKS